MEFRNLLDKKFNEWNGDINHLMWNASNFGLFQLSWISFN